MSDKERLLKEGDELFKKLLSLDVVKKYIALKQAVSSSSHLKKLKEERLKLQKDSRTLPYLERKEQLERAKKLQDDYDSDPLVINYKNSREEVEELLSILKKAEL